MTATYKRDYFKKKKVINIFIEHLMFIDCDTISDFSLPIWWETEKMKKKKKKKETKSDYEFFTFDSKSLDNELEHGLIPVFCCIFEWRL